MTRRAALIILDGWGHSDSIEFNAVAAAGTPRLDLLCEEFPCTTIGTSGMSVGLPEGQMGNSEVGHLNIGAGRVVYQDFTRINLSIENGEFFRNQELISACEKSKGGALHIMGLVSDGGVHSHNTHLYAMVELARQQGVEQLFVHAFLDGRDTPPSSGLGYMEALEKVLEEKGLGRVATVGGRYYAMDRDTRWERIETAYNALVRGVGPTAAGGAEAISTAYDEGETDEFVTPRVITEKGKPVGLIRDSDAIVFINFRADRARQITRAFTDESFDDFDTSRRPALSDYVCFTEYDQNFSLPVAFPPVELLGILAEVLSDEGLTQLRIAETEKYAHVTFFFNGGIEQAYPREKRILIPSPREVETYDQKPEMSAFTVRDRLIEEVEGGLHDVIVVNFANMDMVGHTGNMDAAKKAVRTVDACVGELVEVLHKNGYAVVITADHGNAEQMWDGSSSQPMTAHTLNRVVLILADPRNRNATLREGGILADIAPTLLQIIDIDKPPEMTGQSLIE